MVDIINKYDNIAFYFDSGSSNLREKRERCQWNSLKSLARCQANEIGQKKMAKTTLPILLPEELSARLYRLSKYTTVNTTPYASSTTIRAAIDISMRPRPLDHFDPL